MVTNSRFQDYSMQVRNRLSATSPFSQNKHAYQQRNSVSTPLTHNDRVTSTVPLNWRETLGNILGDNHLSLSTKCVEIEKIFLSLTNKEMMEAFPYLVNNIFEFNVSSSWRLNVLESRRHSYDFNAVRQFLSPNGPLFKVINQLLNEQEVKFQFPLLSFPLGILEMFEKSAIPVLYVDKISLLNPQQGFASFNAFEYYIVVFAHFITQNHAKGFTNTQSAGEDSLYVQLLEDYLQYYFPHNPLLSTNPQFIDTTHTVLRSSKHSSKFSLWKSPELISTPQSNISSYSTTPAVSSTNSDNKSEIFLQLVTDFWLCINWSDSSSRRSAVKLPSTDHARVVRVLIKYLHMYGSMTQQTEKSFISENPYQKQMQDMKRSSALLVVRHKLLPYLKDCFANWSLDGSFRMVLETWLSYIQPWRYTSLSETSLNESSIADVSQWKDFMKDNIDFYTHLFIMFISRAMRMEMRSTSSMQLVYRVAKVYSQSNFSVILRQALSEKEKNSSNKLSIPSNLPNSTSLFSPPFSSNYSTTFSTVGGSVNIFNDDVVIQVQSLCECLSSTCIEIRQKEIQKKQNSYTNRLQRLWQQIRDFFMIDQSFYEGEDKDDDERRLLEYLEHSCSMFSNIFELPLFETHPSNNWSIDPYQDKSNNSSDLPRPNSQLKDDGKTPEFIMTKEGVKLTQRGREQILSRQRHFEFCESWDTEYESVRSYESLWLLKFLHRIAIVVNNKFSQHLYQLYNRNDGLSRILRRISRNVENTRFLNCQIKIPRDRVDLTVVNPRISFRFAASYYYVGYLFWTIMFARLFGFSWLFIIVFILLVFLISVVVNIDSPPRIMEDE